MMQSGMALHTWLSQRKLTLAMLGDLAKNAKAAGWQRPLVSMRLLSKSKIWLDRGVTATSLTKSQIQ